MLRVRKADGRLEPFHRWKVVRTCLRLKVPRGEVERIAEEILKEAYDGIPTQKILELIYEKVGRVRPALKHALDLREAISRLRPKPDFEEFMRKVLSKMGYRVEGNIILEGRCVEHEVDGVAVKGEEVLLLEVKHHVNPHTYTGVSVFLEVWAELQDLIEGHRLGLHEYSFTNALIACNTKISAHAERYARCKGLKHIGWRYPRAMALEDIIEGHQLYPVTMLKGLGDRELERLGDAGLIVLKDLLNLDAEKLAHIIGVKAEDAEDILLKAKSLLKVG